MNFLIKVPIYKRDVLMSFGDSDLVIKKRLHDNATSEDLERLSLSQGVQGRCIILSGGAIVMRLPKVPKTNHEYAVLQHEIFHVADFILARAGIKLSDTSDEAYSYLIEYLTKETYDRL